jgi:hypothetical protein
MNEPRLPAKKAVMAGLVPAIHALKLGTKDVDARHEAGHDEANGCAS